MSVPAPRSPFFLPLVLLERSSVGSDGGDRTDL